MNECCHMAEELGMTKDPFWGWVCHECKTEYDRIDREEDIDQFESDKRQRIAESQEY